MDINKFVNEVCLDRAHPTSFTTRQMSAEYFSLTGQEPSSEIMRDKLKLTVLLCSAIVGNDEHDENGDEEDEDTDNDGVYDEEDERKVEEEDGGAYDEEDDTIWQFPKAGKKTVKMEVEEEYDDAMIIPNFPEYDSLTPVKKSSFSSRNIKIHRAKSAPKPLVGTRSYHKKVDLDSPLDQHLGVWYHFRGNASYTSPWLSYLLQQHSTSTFCVPEYSDHADMYQHLVALNAYTTIRHEIDDQIYNTSKSFTFERDPEIEYTLLENNPSRESLFFYKAIIRDKVKYYPSKTNVHQHAMYVNPPKKEKVYIRKYIPRNIGIVADPIFFDTIARCDKDDKIVYSIFFLTIHEERGKDSHANVLIFNHKTRDLARMEPNGAGSMSFETTVNILFKEFISKHHKVFKSYTEPDKICDSIGPQKKEQMQIIYTKEMRVIRGKRTQIEPGGFCALFSLMFIHFRLDYPDISNKAVMDKMLSAKSNRLAYEIRLYAKHVVNYLYEDM